MTWVTVVLLAPLAGAALLLALGPRTRRPAGALGSIAVLAAFVAAVLAFLALADRPAGDRSMVVHLFQWANTGSLRIGVDLRWDPLSAVMATMVTGVAFLIHVYSIGYMHDDPRYTRFFAYLNLFVFSMLLLVLADNLLVLFAGWELVGVCSYLLIGFWSQRPSAATAAKKAFITTRIGDLGFMIGIFLIFATLGTLRIGGVNHAVESGEVATATATAIALLLFAGAIGKSAQVPLYVWLPDAMEGPTPVSALIHAATMVTAGVYLVVRMGPLFHAASAAATVVAVVGAITAVYAASLALAEEDIKRVLAYSTISQLGYMFLAAGIGAYPIAIFHLVTHAFFKALLFLASGSVMHGLGGETALERMGGLRKSLPWTFGVMSVGWAAITGVLPFAGFFSKDAVVATAWAEGRTALFVVAAIGALMTAFYMSRMLFLTFAGKARWSEGTHAHESPPSMIVPMVVLAALAIVGGGLNLPAALPGGGVLAHFLEPVTGHAVEGESVGVTILLWALAAIGVIVAWTIYGAQAIDRMMLRHRLGPAFTLLRNKFFVDEIYSTLIVAPLRLAAAISYVVDTRVVDGGVNGVATLFARAAASWRRIQTGLVRSYALAVFLGAALLVAYAAVRMT